MNSLFDSAFFGPDTDSFDSFIDGGGSVFPEPSVVLLPLEISQKMPKVSFQNLVEGGIVVNNRFLRVSKLEIPSNFISEWLSKRTDLVEHRAAVLSGIAPYPYIVSATIAAFDALKKDYFEQPRWSPLVDSIEFLNMRDRVGRDGVKGALAGYKAGSENLNTLIKSLKKARLNGKKPHIKELQAAKKQLDEKIKGYRFLISLNELNSFVDKIEKETTREGLRGFFNRIKFLCRGEKKQGEKELAIALKLREIQDHIAIEDQGEPSDSYQRIAKKVENIYATLKIFSDRS